MCQLRTQAQSRRRAWVPSIKVRSATKVRMNVKRTVVRTRVAFHLVRSSANCPKYFPQDLLGGGTPSERGALVQGNLTPFRNPISGKVMRPASWSGHPFLELAELAKAEAHLEHERQENSEHNPISAQDACFDMIQPGTQGFILSMERETLSSVRGLVVDDPEWPEEQNDEPAESRMPSEGPLAFYDVDSELAIMEIMPGDFYNVPDDYYLLSVHSRAQRNFNMSKQRIEVGDECS
eukprot:IDg6147t1